MKYLINNNGLHMLREGFELMTYLYYQLSY